VGDCKIREGSRVTDGVGLCVQPVSAIDRID